MLWLEPNLIILWIFYNDGEKMKKLLNKCPVCGCRLVYSAYIQYTLDSKIKRNGEISKSTSKSGSNSMECGYLSCENADCDFVTNTNFVCSDHKDIRIDFDGTKFYYEIDNND